MSERKAGKQKAKIIPTSDFRPLTSVICRFVDRYVSSMIRSPSARAAHCEEIPDELVRAFPIRSLFWKWRVRRLVAQKRSHEAYLQTDAAFAAAVARLKLPPHDVFFGYSYASLEVLEAEKKRGVLTVLDQIDPGAVEFQLVAEEMARFPELAGPPQAFPAAYYERNQHEWTLADRIVVNSEWSRKALVKKGVAPEKLVVVPLCYEANAEKQKAESRDLQPSTFNPQLSTAPLRVLFLGQVNVRKGIHYLMQAAKLLANEPVQFDVVGLYWDFAKSSGFCAAQHDISRSGQPRRCGGVVSASGFVCIADIVRWFWHYPIRSDVARVTGHHHALLWRSCRRRSGWIHHSATRCRRSGEDVAALSRRAGIVERPPASGPHESQTVYAGTAGG